MAPTPLQKRAQGYKAARRQRQRARRVPRGRRQRSRGISPTSRRQPRRRPRRTFHRRNQRTCRSFSAGPIVGNAVEMGRDGFASRRTSTCFLLTSARSSFFFSLFFGLFGVDRLPERERGLPPDSTAWSTFFAAPSDVGLEFKGSDRDSGGNLRRT